MIGTIRNSKICSNGGLLAAILIAAIFTSSQVACLTHSHCHETDCFPQNNQPDHHHEEEHHHHDDNGGHTCETENSCEDDHHEHDIHHHADDGHSHPQRRFITPAFDTEFVDEAAEETPVSELAGDLPAIDESPPLERYGLIFAERAPPLS